MMELADFREDMLNEASAWAASDLNFEHSSFVEVAVRYLAEAGEVADFEPCYYRGIGRRGRALAIDGYAVDDVDGSVRVFLAEASMDDEMPTLTQTEARGLFGRITGFLEEATAGRLADDLEVSSPTYAAVTDLADRMKPLAREDPPGGHNLTGATRPAAATGRRSDSAGAERLLRRGPEGAGVH